MISACSLLHHDNERQWSINESWFCIIGNLSCELLQTVINGVLAAFIEHMKDEMLPSSS